MAKTDLITVKRKNKKDVCISIRSDLDYTELKTICIMLKMAISSYLKDKYTGDKKDETDS